MIQHHRWHMYIPQICIDSEESAYVGCFNSWALDKTEERANADEGGGLPLPLTADETRVEMFSPNIIYISPKGMCNIACCRIMGVDCHYFVSHRQHF